MARESRRACEVWAVGGGKGGTGKTCLTAMLGCHLAALGKRVVLVDWDLGGANLHNFVGVQRRGRTLDDFFECKTPLADLVTDTPVAGLRLVPGNLKTLSPNIPVHFQKLKLFRQVGDLHADIAIMDLGAGTGTFTIDAFLRADKAILVLAPEITAVENLYQFLKAAVFRKFKAALNAHGHKGLVERIWQNRRERGIRTLVQLVEALKEESGEVRDVYAGELSGMEVHIIVNQAVSPEDIAVGESVKSVCRKYFGICARNAGYLRRDDDIRNSVNRRRAFLESCPHSPRADEVAAIVERLLGGDAVQGSSGSETRVNV